MNKSFGWAAIICCFFVACTNQDKKEHKEKNGTNEKEGKKITTRDVSITAANSYNDLFLDSAAVENFIAEKKLDDALARRMRSFYNARNFQFAWFARDGLSEQALGFWNLHDYYTTYSGDTSLTDKVLNKAMDNLVLEDSLSITASDKSAVSTELTLTQHFIDYSLKNYEKGYVKRKELERFIPRKKEDVMSLADSLLTKKHKDDKYFDDINETYKLLKEQLGKYYNIEKNGGWPAIAADKKSFKKGTSSPVIYLIKKRLQITEDMPGSDTTEVFNDTLEIGVKNFQQRYGYTPDGIIDAELIKEMNVPAKERVKQLLINMDRMRWMPSKPEGNLIEVNIPEFVLHVYEGKNKVFDMNVVVGKEGNNTMMFTGDLNQIVFSPYWNVPSSIVKKEILPAMNRNPNYLARQQMEITGSDGGLPVVRQLPGPKNSLGKVKFLFPNSFNIYFHDTPSKSLFNKDKRAYSHGCIRLSDPFKMAEYLLRNQPEWTAEKINEAMNSGDQKYVKLKEPVPVFISYYTAWVDDKGRLNFREDIYGHDKKIASKMFLN